MTTPVIGPKGERMSFDGSPADWAAAQAEGWRVDDGSGPTALESIKGAAAEAAPVVNALGLGALQGATAGGYGALVGATQPHETKAAVLKAMEENPTATSIGEVGGMLVSPLNKLAPAVEGSRAATALGRLAQKTVGGAAVGALYGAGNAVSESALGDTQLTAEKLITGAGLGALLGGAGGGIGGAIEEGAAKILPKLSTVLSGGQSALDDIADHATLKSFRNTAKELRKYSDAEIADAVAVARDRGHLKLSPESMEKSIAADVAKVGPAKGAFLDAADKTSRPDFAAALKEFDAHVADMRPLERESVASSLKKARSTLEDIATDPKRGTWRAFDEWKQDLQSAAKFSRGAAEDDLALGAKRRLAGFARSELDRQLVPALGTEGQAFLDTKKLYGSLKTAERMAGTGAGRGASFNVVDIGAAIAGGMHLGPFGLAGGLGVKFMREHGAAVAAQIADRLSKSPAMNAVAQSFAKSLPMTAPKLGTYGPALMLAARRSPELALAQHMVTAQVDPEYAANAQMAGLRPELPDEHATALGRATDVAALHASMRSHDEAIHVALQHVVKGTKPAAASGVLKSQDFGSKQMRRDSIEGHKQRVDEVRMLATDPQALIDRVSKNIGALGDVAPGVAAAMHATAQRAVTYLAQQAEVPPKPGPLARDWTPTAAQRHSFTLKLEAVQAPMSILKRAAEGRLVPASLDAVRAVYPAFASQLADKALEQLASGEKMPYRARLMLSMLTGVSADGTTTPAAIAANQMAIMKAAGKPSERLGDTREGGGKLGQAERMASPDRRQQMEKSA